MKQKPVLSASSWDTQPFLMGIEWRFMGVISLLSLVILTAFVLVFLYGLPFSDFRGWVFHEKERAFRTLDRLADIQKLSLTESIKHHLHEVQLLARVMQEDEAWLHVLRHQDDQQGGAQLAMQRHFLGNIEELGYQDYFLVDPRSRRILMASDHQAIGRTWSHEALLTGVMQTGSVYAKHAEEGHNQRLMMHLAAQLVDRSGQPLAVIILAMPMADQLARVIRTMRNLWLSTETVLFLREKEEKHMLFYPYTRSGDRQRLYQDPLFSQSLAGAEGIGEGVDDQGKPVLIAYRHIRIYPEWGCGLAVKVDRHELLAPVDQAMRFQTGLGLAAVLIFILAAIFLTRQVTRPLRQLTGVAYRVAAGERHVRTGMEGQDEIGVLARAMDLLVTTVESQLDRLEEHVADRTRALSEELQTRLLTEQKLRASESRLNAIMDNTIAIIFLKSETGQYLLANRQFLRLFTAQGMDVGHMTDGDLFPLEIARNIRQHDLLALHQQGVVENEEDYPQADGLHTYLVIRFPLIDDKDGSVMVCGIGTDVTERKRMERRLRQAQKLEAIGTLAGGISHDFNNILAIISGHADLGKLVTRSGSEEQDCFDTILQAVHRGRDLVNQLLTFSRQGDLVRELFEPLPVLQETLRFLRSTLPSHIPFSWQVEEHPGFLLGDPTRLQQVLMNLCTNAAQSVEDAGKGGIVVQWQRITVSQKTHLMSGDYFLLIVGDQGTGMASEVRDRVFDPFYTTKAIGRGTGLGLSVVHGIVTDWKGVMEVHTQPGEGAEFKIYLPWYAGEVQVSPSNGSSSGSVVSKRSG